MVAFESSQIGPQLPGGFQDLGFFGPGLVLTGFPCPFGWTGVARAGCGGFVVCGAAGGRTRTVVVRTRVRVGDGEAGTVGAGLRVLLLGARLLVGARLSVAG